MKLTKKFWISTLASVSILAVGVGSIVVLAWDVDAPTPLSTFTLKFNKDLDPDGSKNKLIDASIKATRDILDKYERETGKEANLNFQYANLKSTQTQGERNYWQMFDRTLKSIDDRLGFENLQRTPKLVNEAFYNKNTEMMSFYWNPDYNGVGTWLKYMFTDQYTLANMWPVTFIEINNATDLKWDTSLKAELEKYSLPSKQTPLKLNSSPIDVYAWLASTNNDLGFKIDDYYVNLSNVIGKWVSNNSDIDITVTEDITTYGADIPFGVQFVNWIASKNPNIPFQEVGSKTRTPTLISNGLHITTNFNGADNFRDWYYYEDEFKKSVVNDWNQNDPFQSNEGAWNPNFNRAPNTLAESVFTALTSWTVIGDENDQYFWPKENGHEVKKSKIVLVSNAIYDDISDPTVFEKYENEFNNSKTLTLQIRPIPWVNAKGQNTGHFLSPQDFYAGFKSFKRSIDNGMNVNNAYFTGLLGIDFKKTFEYPDNQLRNTSSQEHKPFTIFFSNPILNLKDTFDILQKQYFCAIPAMHEKVKNIIDDDRYNKIAVTSSNGLIDLSKTDMTQFYGVGDGKNSVVWSNLWFTSPFYISNIDTQAITYQLNKEFFSAFDNVKNLDNYKSFNLETTSGNGNKKIKRINTYKLKYAGSYNIDILFEQFKSGEIDKSPIQGANLVSTEQDATLRKSLRYVSTKKLNKSDIAGFNLQIYEKGTVTANSSNGLLNDATNIIIDAETNEPMWDEKNNRPAYDLDQYGNWDFKGRKPKLKSNISESYYELIAKDYYTPKAKGGISETIRFSIMNTINWVSMATLVTPGVTNSVQYSFMPYGVYELNDKKDPINGPKGEYWDFSANKRYMTKEQLSIINEETLKLRFSGNCIWTYDELLSSMVKINEGGN